jgi:hypothetical protein
VILADLVLLVHFVYVGTVVLPVILIPLGAKLRWRWIRNRTFRAVHVGMMLLVLIESFAGIMCPLTWLESNLRGTGAPGEGFVAYWIHELMFYQFPPWVFVLLYAAFFGVIVGLWRLVPPNRKA